MPNVQYSMSNTQYSMGEKKNILRPLFSHRNGGFIL
jgi:hypothetical protein